MVDQPPPLLPRDVGFVPPPPMLDPMSERIAVLWRRLDGSFLRPLWPAALGALIAGFSLLVARSLLVAAAIALVGVVTVAWFGRSLARRLEEMDRMSG